jgi:hypothetical protein
MTGEMFGGGGGVDSERETAEAEIAGHRAELVATCAKLGISCPTLPRRAIENYFPQRAIDAALGRARFRALPPFEGS